MPGGRVDQTNVPDVLRDHLTRIRKLEANPASGYTPPTAFGIYEDLGEVIPQNAAFGMEFAFASGTPLLDIVTNDFNPSVLTDGIYAFACYAAPTSPQAGAVGELYIDLDTAGANNTLQASAPLDAASASGTSRPSIALTVIYYLAAGQAIDLNCAHSVAGNVTFDFQVIVQKIT